MKRPKKPDIERVDWVTLKKNCIKAWLAGFITSSAVSDEPGWSLLAACLFAAARGALGAAYQTVYGEDLE